MRLHAHPGERLVGQHPVALGHLFLQWDAQGFEVILDARRPGQMELRHLALVHEVAQQQHDDCHADGQPAGQHALD